MAFAHTERPRGNPQQFRKTPALDTLSALAKRGGANINAQQLQQPMPNQQLGQVNKLNLPTQQKPLSPVAVEAMSRQQQPQQQFAMPIEQPQPQPQQPTEDPMGMPMAPEGFTPPPVEGYWRQVLADTIKKDPNLKKGQRDWRHDALDKFSQIREKLDKISQYLGESDPKMISDYVRKLRKGGANV